MPTLLIWNLRFLGRFSLLRKAVKKIFGIYYGNKRKITIKRGPLKGYQWICHKQHQFWMPFGVYEAETAKWLERHIEKGAIFFDVGSNAGYFTLLGSKCIGNGTVVSFEPIPSNTKIIEANVLLNNIKNCVIEAVAISDLDGEAQFSIEKNNANSHLSAIQPTHMKSVCTGTVKVKTMQLDTFVVQSNLRPNLIKIDVEGAEMKVLMGAKELLKQYKPVCIISTHSSALFHDCLNFMLDIGYKVEQLKGFEHELCCYPNI